MDELLVDGRKLKRAREMADLTQGQLALKAKITQAHISRMESGTRPNVKLITLGRLAKALNVDKDTLLVSNGRCHNEDEDDESLSTFLKSVPLHDKKRLSLLLKRIDEMIDADIESVEKTGHGI